MSKSRSNEFVLEPLEPRLLLSAVPMAIPLPSAPITAVEFIEAEVVSDDDELGLDGEWIESTPADSATEAVQLASPLPAPAQVQSNYLNPDTTQLGIEQQAKLLHLANAPPAQRSTPPNILDLSAYQTPISFLLSSDGSVIASASGEILTEMAHVDRILGGSGDDTLRLEDGDADWHINGNNAGSVANLSFSQIETLVGAADSEDRFHLYASGSLSGGLDGGVGGFDTLFLVDGDFQRITYLAASPASGVIYRDANRLAYDGLEPIIDTAQTVDRSLQLTTGADPDARLEGLDADTLLLSGSTFEDVTFELPSSSLTILGLAGKDHLTIGSLALANTSLRMESESITLEAGATLSANAAITLIATDDELAVAAVDRAAAITVAGTINTTASLTLEATSSRNFSTVIDSPATVLTISTAVQIHLTAEASITAGDFSALTRSSGDFGAENLGGTLLLNLDESSTILAEADVTAASISFRSERSTSYQVEARGAVISASGDTRVALSDNSLQSASTLNAQAIDSIAFLTLSPQLVLDQAALPDGTQIELSLARNHADGLTAVSLSAVDIQTAGATSFSARRDAAYSAQAQTDVLLEDPQGSVAFGGTYAANSLLGDVSTTILNSQISITNGGNLTLAASDTSQAHALSGLTVASQQTDGLDTMTLGAALALNIVGWESADAVLAIDALLGTSFGSADPVQVGTALTDTQLDVAGDLKSTAHLDLQRTAIVTNASSTTTAPDNGAASSGATGILATNLIAADARATLSAPNVAQALSIGGALSITARSQDQVHAEAMVRDSKSIATPTPIPHFQSSDGLQSLVFGNIVQATEDFYRYLGSAAPIDLTATDFTDLDFWQPHDARQQTTATDAGTAATLAGVVVRNDLRTELSASVSDATVSAASFNLHANRAGRATALVDVTFAPSQDAFATGSLAATGVLATNMILGKSVAKTTNATLATTRNLSLSATNQSAISANVANLTAAGDTAIALTLAFNTIGWEAQNILFSTVDALIGSSLGTESPADTEAYSQDSILTVGGTLSISASSDAVITATITNAARAAILALSDTDGKSLGGILVSNLISSATNANIRFTAPDGIVNITGATDITAIDRAVISATADLNAISSLIDTAIDDLAASYRFSSHSGSQSLATGDAVRLASDYAGGGTPGATYKYQAAPATFDLANTDFSTGDWLDVRENPPSLDFETESIAVGGTVARNDIRNPVDSYLENVAFTSAAALAIHAEERASITAKLTGQVSNDANQSFGSGNSLALHATIATNIVQGAVTGELRNSSITSAAISLNSQLLANLDATIASATTSGANGTAIGLTFAFNSIGYASQNILFNLIDAILGDAIFGDGTGANATARIVATPVTATGAVTLTATANSALNSSISNKAAVSGQEGSV